MVEVVAALSRIAAIDRSDDSKVACVQTTSGHTYHCPKSLLEQMDLETGSTLSTRQLDRIVRADEVHRAKQAALRLLTARGRTAKDLRDRLRKKQEFADDTIAEVINWLEDLGYLDDREYAVDRLQQLASKGKLGRRGLIAKLESEGVDRLVAEEVVYDTISADHEQQWADALVKKRAHRLRDREPDKLKRTVFAYLQRRGFEHDHVMSALDTLQLDE
jgi:regulatory protein